ncbi:hypothetical protein, partial [Aerococcus sp.]|uniref:hypothetical protein n=1 Tax=Aerococcus sp. TaxID=1872398 RepID=UPI0028AE88B4
PKTYNTLFLSVQFSGRDSTLVGQSFFSAKVLLGKRGKRQLSDTSIYGGLASKDKNRPFSRKY